MGKLEDLSQKANQESNKQNSQPGKEYKMVPRPKAEKIDYQPSNKLKDKVAIITGGDSGIGRAVAILFAKEGADIMVLYQDEHEDACETQNRVQEIGRRCELLSGDVSNNLFCKKSVEKTLKIFNKINILINNAAIQFPQKSILDISPDQLTRTFQVNLFSYFYMIQAVLPHLQKHDSIINSTSVTCYKGSEQLIDYSATKGAIVALTRSLSASLVKQKIRVNGVAPGPIWTPLIPASYNEEHLKEFGKNVPMKRMGQPEEIAPSYLFLASSDSSYMTGQVLHPNGGIIVNG